MQTALFQLRIVRRSLLLALALLVLASCVAESQRVAIRLRNDTGTDLTGVVATYVDQTTNYGALAANAVSDYEVAVHGAYGYAPVTAKTATETLAFMPVDHASQALLAPGWYTLVLRRADEPHTLVLQLVND